MRTAFRLRDQLRRSCAVSVAGSADALGRATARGSPGGAHQERARARRPRGARSDAPADCRLRLSQREHVEQHLWHIFANLGVSGRADLAAIVAADPGEE